MRRPAGLAVDGDDRRDPRQGFAQRFLYTGAQGCEPGGTVGAGALEGDPDRAVPVDHVQLHISAIGNEGRTDLVEPAFDRFASGRQIIPGLCHVNPIGVFEPELNPLPQRLGVLSK